MKFNVTVDRHQPKHHWFDGGRADICINGDKYQVQADNLQVMDGISLEGAITSKVLNVIMSTWGFKVRYEFLHWFGFWHCDAEVYKFIQKFEGQSNYIVDGDELKTLYERWVKEELPRIEEENRKWIEKNDALEKAGKPREDRMILSQVTVDSQPVTSNLKVDWSKTNFKRFNILEIAKQRLGALKEDEQFGKLLKSKQGESK